MKGSPHFLSPADHQLRATGFLTFPVPALTGLFRDRDRDFQRNKIARRERKEGVASRPHAIGSSGSLDAQHPLFDSSLASCPVSSLCLSPGLFPVEPVPHTACQAQMQRGTD